MQSKIAISSFLNLGNFKTKNNAKPSTINNKNKNLNNNNVNVNNKNNNKSKKRKINYDNDRLNKLLFSCVLIVSEHTQINEIKNTCNNNKHNGNNNYKDNLNTKKVSFSALVEVSQTYEKSVYSRSSRSKKISNAKMRRIIVELRDYKEKEMQVHHQSLNNNNYHKSVLIRKQIRRE
eukprot:Pgem_evm1s364